MVAYQKIVGSNVTNAAGKIHYRYFTIFPIRAKAKFFGQKPAAKNERNIFLFIKQKN